MQPICIKILPTTTTCWSFFVKCFGGDLCLGAADISVVVNNEKVRPCPQRETFWLRTPSTFVWSPSQVKPTRNWPNFTFFHEVSLHPLQEWEQRHQKLTERIMIQVSPHKMNVKDDLVKSWHKTDQNRFKIEHASLLDRFLEYLLTLFMNVSLVS